MHSQKLGYILKLGFTNTKISNNRKLLSHNYLSFTGEKLTPPHHPYFFEKLTEL